MGMFSQFIANPIIDRTLDGFRLLVNEDLNLYFKKRHLYATPFDQAVPQCLVNAVTGEVECLNAGVLCGCKGPSLIPCVKPNVLVRAFVACPPPRLPKIPIF